MASEIDLYYQNTRGLKTKLQPFNLAVQACGYNIICLTETWLNESVDSAELFDANFKVYRKDRNTRLHKKNDGGGVLVAVHKGLHVAGIPGLLNCHVIDDVWVKINLSNGSTLIICVVYFNVGIRFDDYKLFFDYLSQVVIMQYANSKFIIVGDFNLSSICWNTSNPNSIFATRLEGRISEYLVDTMELTFLSQFNYVRNNQNKILDLFLSNIDSTCISLNKANYVLSKVDGYHPPVSVFVKLSVLRRQALHASPTINFNKLDYASLSSHLGTINWESLFYNVSAVDRFFDKIFNWLNKFSICSPSTTQRFPCWYSRYLRLLIKNKVKAHKRFKRFRTQMTYSLFSNYRRKVKAEIKNCWNLYIRHIQNSMISNPKLFWSYNKSFQSKSDYPGYMYLYDKSSSNQVELSKLFVEHFRSVYVPDTNLPTFSVCSSSVNLVRISTQEVLMVLDSLDVNKGAGPDRLPNVFLNKLRDVLVVPITLLFNMSIARAYFPSKWKVSFLLPVYKSGDAANIENYRPISILNSLAKIFEKVVYNVVFYQIKSQISLTQHGFFPKRSTLTNLAEFCDTTYHSLDNAGQLDCIYTDFTKAFDKVSHSMLLRKLHSFNLPPFWISWFHSYLVGRRQSVKFNGTISDEFEPNSGVPQGSILGPLLFIVYINDISDVIKSNHLLYADDLKIFRTIKSVEDVNALQADLDSVYNWSIINQLPLNVSKCVSMVFTRRRNIIDIPYNINGIVLARPISFKDLGITFDCKFRFDEHVDLISRKSFKMLGFIIRRGRDFTDPKVLITLFYSLVRSNLEYLSQIWNPFYDEYSNRIERVQRRFSKFLCFKFVPSTHYMSYEIRCNKFNLISLENRRILLDEYFFYKLVNNLVDTKLLAKIKFYVPAYCVRHCELFQPSLSRTNLGLSSPINRLTLRHLLYFGNLDLFNLSLWRFRKMCIMVFTVH